MFLVSKKAFTEVRVLTFRKLCYTVCVLGVSYTEQGDIYLMDLVNFIPFSFDSS